MKGQCMMSVLNGLICVVSVVVLCASVVCNAGDAAPAAATGGADAKAASLPVYIGTYTGPGKSKGIYLVRLNLADGTLSAPELVVESNNPSFLAVHPSLKYMYAVGETAMFNGKKSGAVSAFAIDPVSGKLTLLNQQPSGGVGPCHVTVDKEGKNVLVANYSGGSLAVLPIGPDGKLGEPTEVIQNAGSGPNRKRQEAPHVHSVNVDPAGRFAFVCDLGLDKMFVFRLDADKGKLTPNDPPAAVLAPGSGPRHFTFHTSGKFAYVINELLSTITAYAYDADRGVLTELQTVPTLPDDFKGENTTAEIRVHPSGKFLYGSNRGHESIVVYAIDAASGKLTFVDRTPSQGKHPRNFAIDPTGAFLLAANMTTGNVVVFRIDQVTGKLTPTGSIVNIPAAVCVKFMPAGK